MSSLSKRHVREVDKSIHSIQKEHIQGWLYWIANSTSFIFTHMVLGTTFALSLLALSLIQLLTGRMRLLGASGIVYTLILTALGFTQTGLLVGPMHWLIQTAHVVIGFGALVLVQVISVRDARLRRKDMKEAHKRRRRNGKWTRST